MSILVLVASEVVTQYNITCEPLVVRISDHMGFPTRLRVDLKPVNIPTCEGLDYRVLAYSEKDGHHRIKAILKVGSKCMPNQNIILYQNVNIDWDNCHIAFCLHEKKKFGCEFSKDKFYDVIILKYTEEPTSSACTAPGGKCELTLDVGNYCKNLNPSGSTQRRPDHGDMPKLFIDCDYDPRVTINCFAVGQKFDLLSLYQNQPKGPKHVLLKIVQYLKEEEGQINMTLNKTVSVYDKGSTIYCVKHKPDYPSHEKKSNGIILRDGDYNYMKVRWLVPNISVEPDTEAAEFSRDRPLNLICKGPALIDDQSLTWYMRDQNTSELEVPDASGQQYNQTTNESRLSLRLNRSYDSKTLFCAQDGHLVVVHASGRRSVVRYGEAATSRNITLKLQEKTDDEQAGGPGLSTCVNETSIGIHPHNDVHELESKIQADEAIRARAPCPPPEDLTYDQVYAHGAGLKRPRRK